MALPVIFRDLDRPNSGFERFAKQQNAPGFTDPLDDVNGVATTIRKLRQPAMKPDKETGGGVSRRANCHR